jgi:hypothetical protein
MPMMHLVDLMGSANYSWASAAFALASSLSLHLSRVLGAPFDVRLHGLGEAELTRTRLVPGTSRIGVR